MKTVLLPLAALAGIFFFLWLVRVAQAGENERNRQKQIPARK